MAAPALAKTTFASGADDSLRVKDVYGEGGGGVGGEGHVQRLLEPGVVEEGGDRVDVGGLAIDDVEAGRAVHPGVGGEHEDAGEGAGDGAFSDSRSGGKEQPGWL